MFKSHIESAFKSMPISKNESHQLQYKTIVAVSKLGGGKYARGYQMLKEVASRQKKFLGPKDCTLLFTQSYLARALDGLERYEESLALYEDVLDKLRGKLGTNESLIRTTQQNMVSALHLSRANRRPSELYGGDVPDTTPEYLVFLVLIEHLEKRVGPKKFAELESKCEKNDDFTKLIVLIKSGDVSGVNDMLESEIDMTQVTDVEGSTTLQIAIQNNSIDIVRCLLKHADRHLVANKKFKFINARTKFAVGNTAMHMAAINGSLEAVKVLLEYGAAYNIRNRQGKTPFDLTDDQHTKSFLALTDVIFKEVREGDFTVINKLGELNRDELSIVTSARNEEGYSLQEIRKEFRDRSSSSRSAKPVGRKYCYIL